MQVIGRVLAGALLSGRAGEIVHAAVSHEFMREMKVSGDEFNRIIQTLCFLEGIEVAIIFRETTGEGGFPVAGAAPGARTWKLSLRSRGKVDVAAAARELDPQGGGHDRAAGCSLAGELDEVRARAIDHIARKLAAARA
jgi:phosphoesterase RecJ-like protein